MKSVGLMNVLNIQGSHSDLTIKIQDFFRTLQDLIYRTISTYFYTVFGLDL